MNKLLSSLRMAVIDESEPLAGLLRKCLLLGAETGSVSLRQWARYELNGYNAGVELPGYRKMQTPPIAVEAVLGNTHSKNVHYHRLQLPQNVREHIPEVFEFRQPIEELEGSAEQGSISFTGPMLFQAQSIWNRELGPFEQVLGMSFSMTGSLIAGILGQIRTHLVDLISELTSETPLNELPSKKSVDTAMGTYVGTQYNTTIHTAKGATAIGDSASAINEGYDLEDVLELLENTRVLINESHSSTGNDDLLEALDDLQEEIKKPDRAVEDVVTKAGRLKTLAQKFGVSSVGGTVEGVTSALMTALLSGTL